VSGEATPVRRRLSAEERRGTILESALAVFSARGYHNASIDDIAREAGISKALIYEHFSSKLELYTNLLQDHADELFARLAGAVAETQSGEARLATGLAAFFSFVEERRDAWRILFREAAEPEVAAVLDRIVAEVTAVVATLIAEDPGARSRVESQADRDQAIQLLAQMLVGAIQTVANWWADHREVPPERLLEIAMDFAWVGLERLSQGERWPRA
jgi:AcrR family transcriptional regulator